MSFPITDVTILIVLLILLATVGVGIVVWSVWGGRMP